MISLIESRFLHSASSKNYFVWSLPYIHLWYSTHTNLVLNSTGSILFALFSSLNYYSIISPFRHPVVLPHWNRLSARPFWDNSHCRYLNHRRIIVFPTFCFQNSSSNLKSPNGSHHRCHHFNCVWHIHGSSRSHWYMAGCSAHCKLLSL